MTASSVAPAGDTESVEEFRERAKRWLAANMPSIDPKHPPVGDRGDDEPWQRARELQARIYAGGFAGICFPVEVGGLGLPYAYQQAFSEEARGYEMPLILNIPSLTICCATILDMGTEAQKRQHIGAALRGDEVLVQLLSEPSGGSDLAGVITRADRRGDRWVINGAKTWTTSGFAADYGLCLARTDWNVPKHEGLTMFLVPMDAPGLTMRRIKQVNGSIEFCEEFFDDLELGDDAVLGRENNGWDVASRQMYHERRAMGNGSEFASGASFEAPQSTAIDFVDIAERTGQAADDRVRESAGRAMVYRAVSDMLSEHVYLGVSDGSLPPAAGSITRAFEAEAQNMETDTALSIAGTSAAVGADASLRQFGERYLARQSASLGGGSVEIARNVIAERVLGFPREFAADRGMPFNEVRRNQSGNSTPKS